MKKTLVLHAAIAGMMLAAALLGGCDRSTPEGEPKTANSGPDGVATTAAAPPLEHSVTASLPAPNPSAASNIVAEAPNSPTAPDAQILDDADATGMTARVSRDAATINEAANQ